MFRLLFSFVIFYHKLKQYFSLHVIIFCILCFTPKHHFKGTFPKLFVELSWFFEEDKFPRFVLTSLFVTGVCRLFAAGPLSLCSLVLGFPYLNPSLRRNKHPAINFVLKREPLTEESTYFGKVNWCKNVRY